MRLFYVLFLGIFLNLSLLAQDSDVQLKVEYKKFIEFDFSEISVKSDGSSAKDREFEKAIQDALAKPQFFELLIKNQQANYKRLQKVSNEQPQGDGISISFSSGSGNNIKWMDLDKKVQEDQVSYPKSYIVVDSLKKIDWKITREKGNHCGFETKKAIWEKNDSVTVTAFYAPKLNFRFGPDDYWGLPGLILELEQVKYKDGKEKDKQSFYCEAVEVPEKPIEIQVPEKGKRISQEEYEAIMDEYSKKMKEMYGGGVDTSD